MLPRKIRRAAGRLWLKCANRDAKRNLAESKARAAELLAEFHATNAELPKLDAQLATAEGIQQVAIFQAMAKNYAASAVTLMKLANHIEDAIEKARE